MKTRTAWVALIVGASCLACVTPEKKTLPASNAARNAATPYQSKYGKVVCTYERPVGSNIPERRCVYEEDADQARRETQNELIQHPHPQLTHGG
jgi:hypothetical protein